MSYKYYINIFALLMYLYNTVSFYELLIMLLRCYPFTMLLQLMRVSVKFYLIPPQD